MEGREEIVKRGRPRFWDLFERKVLYRFYKRGRRDVGRVPK